MIAFDPIRMAEPLAQADAALRADGAFAAIVHVDGGARSARVAGGVSDRQTGAAARPDQTFDAGSQAKMMTAVVVLQLAEEGLVDLDAPVARQVPAAVTAGVPNADTATVRQLLAMTSGVPNYTDAEDVDGVALFAKALLGGSGDGFGPDESLDIARTMAAPFEPGAGFLYSNTNYTLLGQLIETVTGAPLADAYEARVFAPAGMAHSSARPFEIDDPRLSSYTVRPDTGEIIDVTDAPWRLLGEGGVITTTADMIAFMRALLVDGSLLSPAALAQMTDFSAIDGGGDAAAFRFGLGLARIDAADGRQFVGFTGGTLGASSSTYLDLASGTVVSMVATSPEDATLEGSLALALAVGEASAWAPVVDDGGPLWVASGAAADMALVRVDAGLRFAVAGASVTLDRTLARLAADDVQFADGSVLVVGDGRASRAGDARANDIDILRDFAASAGADNRLLGLGGDDALGGGLGADRIGGGAGGDRIWGRAGADDLAGKSGDDRLHGQDGDDRLRGGDGADVLVGGRGRDVLTGGADADVFVFRAGDSRAAGGRDMIRDFTSGIDRIDLRALADATAGDRLAWIGDAAFAGGAGEVRCAAGTIRADLDGDGAADVVIRLLDAARLDADDLML